MKNSPIAKAVMLCTSIICYFSGFGQNCPVQTQCGNLPVNGGFAAGSATFFCEGEVVAFENTSDPSLVDTTIIDWGDGRTSLLIGNQLVDDHIYDFAEDTCLVGTTALVIPIDMTVINSCPEGRSVNCFRTFVQIQVDPVASFNNPRELCAGVEFAFTNNSCENGEEISYSWDFGDGNSSTEINPFHTYNAPGQYTVRLTATNECGSDETTRRVEVRDVPVARGDFVIDPIDGCADVIADFIGNNSLDVDTYCWNITPNEGFEFIDSTFKSSPNPRVRFFTAGMYEVELVVENFCGTNSQLFNLEIFESPTVSLTPFSEEACESIIYTPEVTYTGTIESVQWSFEGGSPSSSTELEPQNIEFIGGGTYPIRLEVSGPCSNNIIFRDTVIVATRSAPTFTAPDTTCSTAASFQIIASPGGGTFSGPGVSRSGQFDPSNANIGLNRITYTQGPSFCQSTGEVEIFVLGAPSISISNPGTLCTNAGTFTLNFSPIGGQWSGTGIVDSLQGVFDPAIAGGGQHQLIYTFTNPNTGCSNSEMITINVSGPENITIQDATFCAATSINLEDELNINESGGQGSWQGDGVTNANNGIFSPEAAGFAGQIDTFSLIYTFTTNDGCISTDSIDIEIIPKQDADAGPDQTVCISDETLILNANISTGEWSGNDIDSRTGEIDLRDAGGGFHTYTFTAFAGTTCETSDQVVVEIIDLQGVEAGPNAFACETDNQITLSGFSAPAGSNGSWSSTDPNVIFIDTINGMLDISNLDPGEYRLQYQVDVSDPNLACSNQDEITLTIAEQPITDFTFDAACVNELVQFSINSDIADAYHWTFGDGNTATDANPTNTYNNSGDFTVTVESITFIPNTNQRLCSFITSQEIHISSPPDIVAFTSAPLEGCADLEISLTNNSAGEDIAFEWLLNGEVFSNETTPDNLTLGSGRSDTTYTITLQVANGCGGDIASETILVRPLPKAAFVTDFDEYCSGDTVFLSNNSFGNPDSYAWNLGNGQMTRDSLPPIAVYFTDSTRLQTISLIVENNCGIDTLTKEIIINPPDVQAFFNTNNTDFCVGDTVCFTNASTFNAALIYDFGDGNTNNEPNPCHVYAAPGEYKVVLKAFGCGFDSAVAMIRVNPIPIADFQAPAVVCPGDSVFFTQNAIGAVDFDWDFGDGNTSILNNPIHVFNRDTTFDVRLRVTSSNGCMDEIIKAINIQPSPTASYTFTDSICAGETVFFSNTSLGIIGSCNWDFGDGNFSSDCNPQHIFNEAGNYAVGLEFTNGAGCRDTLYQSVFVRAIPIPDFDFNALSPCSPTTMQFQELSQFADSFSWDFGDGNSSTATNPVHTYENGGIYTVTLTVVSNGICTRSISKEVEIFQKPTASFVQSEEQGCANFAVSFTNNSIGNIINQQWDFGDGIFSFEENPSHTFESVGNFTVTLIVETEQCSDTTSSEIQVFPPITASQTLTHPICNGDETGVIDIIVTGGTPDFVFSWADGSELEDRSELPTGTYNLLITDANGCRLQRDIVIEQPDPIVVNIIEEKIVTCAGQNDGLLTIEAQGGTPDYRYEWEIGVNGPSISNVPADTYQLTITDANGCVLEAALNVAENTPIQPNDSLSHISCFGNMDGTLLLENISGGVAPYLAEVSGPNGFMREGFRFENLGSGFYDVFIRDANGCSTTLEREVIEPDSIFIDILEKDQNIFLGEEVFLPTNTNASEPFYQWLPTHELDCFDCPAPVALPFTNTTYQVMVTDAIGCTATDTIRIEVVVVRGVYIPSAFTPNGDGKNDIFRIRGDNPAVSNIKSFRVFDRWGELIFEAGDYLPTNLFIGWDGTFKGRGLPPAVFAYTAEIEYVDGQVEVRSGDVTLIR